jgi:hypothetical protein
MCINRRRSKPPPCFISVYSLSLKHEVWVVAGDVFVV